jgi:hypothetical protein
MIFLHCHFSLTVQQTSEVFVGSMVLVRFTGDLGSVGFQIIRPVIRQ